MPEKKKNLVNPGLPGNWTLSIVRVLSVGMSSDGVNLMQNYVDQSGDVQTAAIITAHCGIDVHTAKDHRLLSWCTAYQDLLDTWRLWHQR